jgi:5-methylcytosine-specific restriction protein A
MTWNPTRWDWSDYPDYVMRSKTGQILQVRWSTGNNRSIVPGERVYLIRQAIDRGIVGSGVTTSAVERGVHWTDPDKTCNYVEVDWDILLWPQQGLPTATLLEAMPEYDWDRIQASGTSVPSKYLETFQRLWVEHLASVGQGQPFQVGQAYARKDVYRILRVPRNQQHGDWDTGSHQYDDHFYIFATVGASGRTGHDYENYWDGNELVWKGRNGSRLRHPKTQALLNPPGDVRIFTRGDNRSQFTYEGRATAVGSEDTAPVTIRWRFVHAQDGLGEELPDELPPTETYREGTSKQILVNAYERNPAARRKCLEHFGYTCQACEFSFEEFYGSIAKEFIHVHHLIDLASIGHDYEVHPINDLRPVCPNCHAILHKTKPPMSIEMLRTIIATQKSLA